MDKENKHPTQLSEFPRAMNAMLDNLENVVVAYHKILLEMLKKIEKLESSEAASKDTTAPEEERDGTKDIKQLTNEPVLSEETHTSHTSSLTDMPQKTAYPKKRFILGLCTLIVGFIAANLTIFNWIKVIGLHHLLGHYTPYICAFGGFAAMIFGTMLIDDFLLISLYSQGNQIPP